VNAVVWRPASPGPKAGVVVVNLHDNSNNLDSMVGPELARRGYTVIAASPRTAPDASDSDTDWNKDLIDVGAVVKYARGLPGTTKVVLVGHSSGGPLMASYQNIAENGVKACNGPEKIIRCPDSLAGLPKADGLVILDPIWGVGANVLNSMEPGITDEAQPRRLDPALDSYRAENGFVAAGSNYSADFRRRFFAAQAARNNRTIEAALVRNREIDAGRGRFADDEPFLIPGATRRPRLWPTDLHLLSHTRGAWPLLRADGRTTTEVIRSVRPTSGTTPTSPTLNGGALNTSVKRFLSTFATRALPDYAVLEDGVTGIDWASSYSNTPNNVEGVTVPFLVMGMTGHYWLVSSEMAYQHAGSADKTIAFVEGATHGFTPCPNCNGQYGDTVARTFDYIAGWMAPRF
jgi:pimeloyl-ACP methyl ester carboxylesterase